MAKRIYLVRHGETNSNSSSIVQGHDDELSVLGRTQAEQLTRRLRKLTFKYLLVSDYKRTRQTVEPLLPYITVTPEYTQAVRETKQPSSMVGKLNTSEEFQRYYQLVTENLHNPSWRYEDEETFFDVAERVKSFLADVQERDGDVLVVTHGRFIVYIVMYILTNGNLTSDVWQKCRHGFETTNTGITELIYNERFSSWRLLTFNDQAHFAE